MRIIFIGTADFGIPSLDLLLKNNYTIVGVVTALDKPAGRGLKLNESPVKQSAKEKNLKILQPKNQKDENFLTELKSLKADLQIVIAFRMMPKEVWQMPPLGTINLHGSLLPQYRGAAPINRAIINGEKETGVTTFFVQHEIDTGKIIFQEKTIIDENENAGQLHDRLSLIGAELILKTVRAIEKGNCPQTEQNISSDAILKKAPKIFKNDCKINWNYSVENIYNFIRGLSPYPTAWTKLDDKILKIFSAKKEIQNQHENIGKIISDEETFLKIAVQNGFIYLTEVQLEGKNKMRIEDFLRGNKINSTQV